MNGAPQIFLGRVQNLFDNWPLTHLGTDRQSFHHKDEHDREEIRFGTLKAKGSNGPLSMLSRDSLRPV